MLPIAENIRALRNQKQITQTELANALNVTFQSISRWETGQTYPDIELLPVVSAYFGVTIDRLLGADERGRIKKREEILRAYNQAYDAAEDGFGKYEIMAKASEEYPDVERFASLAVTQLTWHNALPMEEALPHIRTYAERLLRSENLQYRQQGLHTIFCYEQEDRLEDWLEAAPDYFVRSHLLHLRYAAWVTKKSSVSTARDSSITVFV